MKKLIKSMLLLAATCASLVFGVVTCVNAVSNVNETTVAADGPGWKTGGNY